MIGAFVHEGLCGYANCMHVALPDGSRAVLIAPIYVDASQRRRQLGRHLLRVSLQIARENGAARAFAWIHLRNAASQAMFRALNFGPGPADEQARPLGPGRKRPTPQHHLWWRPLDPEAPPHR